jgi:small subunit ribosomal protein S6
LFHEYEIVVIVRPDVDDADVKSAIERAEETITSQGGHLLERDDWGKRKLAYLIKKHSKGYYVLIRALSSPEHITELERRLRLDDRVIRFLTVKISEAVDVEFMLEQAVERRKAAELARAEREAADAEAAARGEDRSDDYDDYSAAMAD